METTQLSETDIERLKTWVKKLIPEQADRIDLHSIIDRTLTYSENQTEIKKHIKNAIKSSSDLESELSYARAQEEKREADRKKRAEEEMKIYNETLKYDENKDLEAYYSGVHRVVNKIRQGYSNLAFIKGRGGIGKSRNIRAALLKNGKKPEEDFLELTGEVTAAYLYRLLHQNNGKIIWLKDLTKLLNNQDSVNLLKAATESEENRVLTKSSYSKEQKDLPSSFLCRCKFIFDYNNLLNAGLQADFEALTTRGDFVELSFCDEELAGIMRLIAKDGWQSEVTEYLINKHTSEGLLRLNLRTQWKAFNTYQYAQKNGFDWKAELDDELKRTNKIRSLLYGLIGKAAVPAIDLKRKLLKLEMVNTVRTADNRVNDWIFLEELYVWNDNPKNMTVCINPPNKKTL